MPYRSQNFENGKIYHVVTRGIDDNKLFKNKNDYYRGIYSIYEFNTVKPTNIRERRSVRTRTKKLTRETNTYNIFDTRDHLIEILAFCLMPNHIHLLVRQLKYGGVTRFMNKFGAGYGGYFNRKYKRKGYVFQNRFISVEIKKDKQLKIVFAYIHGNPTSIIVPNWKEKGVNNLKLNKVVKFIEKYKWSSYSDYIGNNNFPSVTNREFLLQLLNGERGCKEFVIDWIKYKGKIKIKDQILLD